MPHQVAAWRGYLPAWSNPLPVAGARGQRQHSRSCSATHQEIHHCSRGGQSTNFKWWFKGLWTTWRGWQKPPRNPQPMWRKKFGKELDQLGLGGVRPMCSGGSGRTHRERKWGYSFKFWSLNRSPRNAQQFGGSNRCLTSPLCGRKAYREISMNWSGSMGTTSSNRWRSTTGRVGSSSSVICANTSGRS